MRPSRTSRTLLAAAICALSLVFCASASAALHVHWMKSYAAPGTPARYDKVGVLKIGPAHAKNVLVLEPGTSAGSAYFVPLAQWLVSKVKGWQVWSVERRENLLEDQSMLNRAKRGKATPQQVFDYYIGYLINKSIKHHFNPVATAELRQGVGLNVAVQDLHTVISAARKLGGKVVLGGHSLGGSVVTGYAAWNFHGHAGADQLAGLVYDDGASFGAAPSAQAATQTLQAFESPGTSPWLPFVAGIPPWDSGLFGSTGGLSAILDPNQPLASGESALLPAALKTPVPVTNLAEFGWGTSVATSQLVFAIKAHDGAGLDSTAMANGLHGWNSAGVADADQALREDAVRIPAAGRRRNRVVLPPAPDRGQLGDRQRKREPRPGGVRDQGHDGPPPSAQPADVRVRRVRRHDDHVVGRRARRAVADPEAQPDARQPP